ncbi:MAG: sigma-70 family RNA polymerase sigma factor [Chitinophagales bacterium]|nr:sigma-70 family RNA polymerase sigma factor [Chitinophagales bacterium]
MHKATPTNIDQLVDHLFREEYGKVVSFLTTKFGFHFLESAQDIAQDTLVEAYRVWSYKGIPQNPPAWIFSVAKNKAINWIKREQKKYAVYQAYEMPRDFKQTKDELSLDNEIQDSMLQMIFTCCHPEIAVDNQIPLVLSILCGFSRKEMAHALLTSEETIKKRLYRAKKQIREKGLMSSITIKEKPITDNEIHGVCISIYLLFNEGYNSPHKDELIRKDLCLEAIRLTKLLVEKFESNTRLRALLATMCFHIARFEARIDDKGVIVLLQDQNRQLWNQDFIKMGLFHLSEAASGHHLSAYHLEASIAAQHCLAKDFESTNWKLIQHFYQQLYQLKPSPVILLNLAIVSGIIDGADTAISQLIRLQEQSRQLKNYYLLYAVLGHFYLEQNKKDLALENFQKAKSLTASHKEIDLLNRKIKSLGI